MKRHIYAYNVVALSASGIAPGDVELTAAGEAQLGLADGTPLRLDTTLVQVTSFAGVVGAAGLARSVTYTVTGLRPGQRAIIGVAWGNPTAVETLQPTLGAGSPAGSAILGDPSTAGEGQTAFLSGAASAGGVATVIVLFTASGAASWTIFAWGGSVGLDPTDTQVIAFA